MVVTTQQDNKIAALFGNRDGIFQGLYTISSQRGPVCVQLKDLNQDEKLDLVVVNDGDNSITVMLGDGEGMFPSFVIYPVGISPYSVTIRRF